MHLLLDGMRPKNELKYIYLIPVIQYQVGTSIVVYYRYLVPGIDTNTGNHEKAVSILAIASQLYIDILRSY